MNGTTLAFGFPWGRYHATPWGRNVNEGVAEWPPSPWRILRSLYAVWQNRLPDLAEETVIPVLGRLTGAPDYLLPDHTEFHTRHYMPDEKHHKGLTGNTDKVLDPFVAIPPGSEVLVRWQTDLSAEERHVLGSLARELTYLGRAESVCAVRLVEEGSSGEGWLTPLGETTSTEEVRVLVATPPLDIPGLTARPSVLRSRRRINPPGSQWVDYPRPLPLRPTAPARTILAGPVTAIRFAISTPARPSRKAAVTMAHVFRQACMSRYGAGDSSRKSATLAGKSISSGPLDHQHLHAHYLAFTEGEDPRLETLVLWAPGGFTDEEVRAVTSLRRLKAPSAISDFRPCRLGLEAFGDLVDVAPRLVGPAKRWRSFTPFAPTHHSRQRDLAAFLASEVARELGYRGLPEPTTVEIERSDWLSFRRHRPTGRDRLGEARRAYGLRLEFAQEVRGPIAIGDLSHFGLGLFLPIKSG